MATRLQEYKEKYSDQTIRFNPYAVKKMGLQQSQTLLKLEDYMLICAPYQLSMDRVILLVQGRPPFPFMRGCTGKTRVS